jgi:ATP phosphoribosyltransferase
MELIEARLRARHFRRITANIKGESEAAVARHVIAQMETAGAQGPTIARVYPKQVAANESWFAVTLIVPVELLLKAVDHLRRSNASGITVLRPEYLFEGESWAYRQALHELDADE